MNKYALRFIFLFFTIITMMTGITGITGCADKKQPDAYKGMSAQDIYNKGKANALNKRYSKAIKDFEAVESRFPYGEYTEKAQLALMHAYYKENETAPALATAERFIKLYPKHKYIDFAYYMKGLINYDANYSAVYRYFPIERSKRDPSLAIQAFDDFKILLEKYPSSIYANDAKLRMLNLREQLAKYELHIANYYMNKEAFLAAANRAGYIVKTFRNTNSVKPALELMVEAYQKLGMHELAENAKLLLNSNFSK